MPANLPTIQRAKLLINTPTTLPVSLSLSFFLSHIPVSNEIFFTGRNIFPLDTHVAQHFINAVVEEQPCAIIRKPFRLEEFDDYLSKNEETDNFVALQAGNEHFVVLTSE